MLKRVAWPATKESSTDPIYVVNAAPIIQDAIPHPVYNVFIPFYLYFALQFHLALFLTDLNLPFQNPSLVS